jgi:hypothetical protein
MKLAIAASLLALLALVGCDDDSNNAANQGGGPGSSDPNTVIAPGAGFCEPEGGSQALGQASYTSDSTAKIDTDGNPAMQGHDSDWNPNTSGSVNGQAVNSAQYAYVVMSPGQMAANNVALGDWATVTNNATGQQTYARVEDEGPAGGSGEISQAAATAVGIQYESNTFTVGNPSVTVDAYGGTASIQSDCASQVASNP